jgi:hypothetical protein
MFACSIVFENLFPVRYHVFDAILGRSIQEARRKRQLGLKL